MPLVIRFFLHDLLCIPYFTVLYFLIHVCIFCIFYICIWFCFLFFFKRHTCHQQINKLMLRSSNGRVLNYVSEVAGSIPAATAYMQIIFNMLILWWMILKYLYLADKEIQ